MPEFGVFVYSPAPADPMRLSPEYVSELERYHTLVEELGGRIVTGFAFQLSDTAVSVRSGDQHAGPIHASDLVVAGYYVIDAPDMVTAVRIAGLNPAVRDGGVEIHPLFVPPAT